MKKDIMKILANWRCRVLIYIFCVTIILAMCDSNSFVHFILSKIAALVCVHILYRLYCYFDVRREIDELKSFGNKF